MTRRQSVYSVRTECNDVNNNLYNYSSNKTYEKEHFIIDVRSYELHNASDRLLIG